MANNDRIKLKPGEVKAMLEYYILTTPEDERKMSDVVSMLGGMWAWRAYRKRDIYKEIISEYSSTCEDDLAELGRPSVYSQQMLDRAAEYLLIYKDLEQLIPTYAGLAGHLDISLECVDKWNADEEKIEFRSILEKLRQEQLLLLLNGGLGKMYDKTITKLILSSNHGIIEKKTVDNTSSDGSMSPNKIEIVPG